MRDRFSILSKLIPLFTVVFLLFGCPAPDSGGGGGSTVATPSFVTPSGTIIEQDTATIAITCATAGAAIHYTIDGSTPTAASPTYSTAIAASLFNLPTGNGPAVVKTMATLSGSSDSAVVTATYTVQDTRAPIPVITSATTGVNDDFQITVTFDEDIPVFSGNVLSLPPGTYDTITAVSGSVYTIWIRHDTFSVGNIVFNVPVGVCQDSSGIPNAVSSPDFSIYFDPNAPQPTIAAGIGITDPTSANTIPITITFDRDVTGFSIGDVQVNPGALASASNFQTIDASHYSADLVVTGQGNITVDIGAGVCASLTLSPNVPAAQFAITHDSVAPDLTAVTPATGGYATSSPVLITVDWSEPVTGFTSGDITNLVNCSVSNFTAVSGSQYTFDLTPGSQAAFSFDIAAGVCTDLAGNTSTGSAAWSKTYHSTVPAISAITPVTNGYWNALSAVPVTIDWNEDVTGFDASDIGGLTNASVSAFTAVSATQYTFDLTPSVQGAFGFTIAAGACVNIASTSSTGPVSWTRTFDTVAPSVYTVTPATGGFTATSPVNVEVDWTEAVAGFTAGDIGTLVNCTISNFNQVAPDQYTFDLTPSSEAAFSFEITSGICADLAGNTSTGTTAWSMTYSASLPFLTITPVDSGWWTTSSVPVTIDWDKTVTGFTSADIGTLVNCSVSNFTAFSGTRYTFDLTPSVQGNFGFTVADGACNDLASNPSAGPVAWSRAYDSVGPTVSSVTPATGGYTATSPFSVTVDWSEDVAGFTAGDIGSLVNCTVSNFTAVSASQYTFDLTPGSDAAFSFTIASSACADLAGNTSSGTTVWSKTYHTTIPSIASISPVTGGYWTGAALPVTIDWNEDVTGFDAADIGSLVNATVSNWVAVSGSQYTFDLTPTLQGNFGFTIAASACQDVAANNSTGPVSWSRDFDNVGPTVSSVNPATGGYATASPVTINVFWDESVSGFDSSDITSLTNCTVGNWTAVSGSQYSFDLTPASEAAFSFQIGSSVCADAAGNASTGTTSWSGTFDATAPTVSAVTPATGGFTTAATTNVQVDWTESVTGFTSADIGTLVNCTVSNFTAVSGTQYTFDLTPTVQGAFGFTIVAGVCTDTAGNTSTGTTSWSRTYDTVQPGVTSITSTTQTRTGRNPIPVTVVFSEAINPATFTAGDFTLTNGTAGTPTTADNITWTVNITPTGAGAVSVNLAAGVVQDPAGNNNTAGTALARTYITAISYSAAAVTARGAGATRTTGAYNAGANANTIVLVSVVAEKTTAGAVDTPATTTFAGQACARITGAHQQYINGNYSLASDMYFIMNPATRNGTASVTLTAAASEAKISVFALYDVNPGTSYGVVATNSGINVTAITTNITSTYFDSLLVDVTGGSTNSVAPTQGAGQTSCWQLRANGAIGLGARKAITTIGANSMSYTALTAQAERMQQSVIEIIIAQ